MSAGGLGSSCRPHLPPAVGWALGDVLLPLAPARLAWGAVWALPPTAVWALGEFLSPAHLLQWSGPWVTSCRPTPHRPVA